MAKRFESLQEIREVTEWRDGCIYRTRVIGERWIDFTDGMPTHTAEGYLIVSLSSQREAELEFKTLRTLRS